MRPTIALLGPLACLSILPAEATAHGSHYFDDRNTVWHHSENANGGVLRSGGIVVYDGRSCDVRSPQLGSGRWGWANGGFIVRAGRRRLAFTRQDPPVPSAACDVGDL